MGTSMSIWRWSQWLTPVPEGARITLGEGMTPVVRSRRIGPSVGLKNLFFKLEMMNPSGSYKDRFAVTAISDMAARGKTRCIATSSGNTGAALAAYCAAAGIRCEIAIVEKAPQGKLKQMLAYGATLYRIKEFGISSDVSQRVVNCLQTLASRPEAQMQISAFRYSPAGMTGVYSMGHELAEQGDAPWDHVFCMAGGGGLVLAVARGFEQALAAGKIPRLPRVECVQPAGNDTMAGALRAGRDRSEAITCTSRISGLQVPTVVDGDEVIAACRRNGGTGHLVSDELIWETQKRLSLEEGIFAEPAGATAVAGAVQAARNGEIDPKAYVVCPITGSAFKDPPSLDEMIKNVSCPMIDVAELERRVEQEG
jgi:threonine synthase